MRVYETSMNDHPDGISLLLIINGCNQGCKYCFNKILWNKNNSDFKIYKTFIDKHNMINNTVLGGGDICKDENQKLTKQLCNYLKTNNKNVSLQVSILSLEKSIDFLLSLDFDSIQVSLNGLSDENMSSFRRLVYMSRGKFDVFTRVVYLENEKEMPDTDIIIDDLQVDYFNDNLYNDAKNYAKKHNIRYLISKQKGREII